MHCYDNIIIRSGGALSVKSFDGREGGVLRFRVAGALLIEKGGVLHAFGRGRKTGYAFPTNIDVGVYPIRDSGFVGGGLDAFGGLISVEAEVLANYGEISSNGDVRLDGGGGCIDIACTEVESFGTIKAVGSKALAGKGDGLIRIAHRKPLSVTLSMADILPTPIMVFAPV